LWWGGPIPAIGACVNQLLFQRWCFIQYTHLAQILVHTNRSNQVGIRNADGAVPVPHQWAIPTYQYGISTRYAVPYWGQARCRILFDTAARTHSYLINRTSRRRKAPYFGGHREDFLSGRYTLTRLSLALLPTRSMHFIRRSIPQLSLRSSCAQHISLSEHKCLPDEPEMQLRPHAIDATDCEGTYHKSLFSVTGRLALSCPLIIITPIQARLAKKWNYS
jgi:hypothetical protein